MVVEELIAKLGIKIGSLADAKKFVKELEKIQKATKALGKDIKINLTGNANGLGKIAKDFDQATAALRRYRMEAQRASKVRFSPAGMGGGGRPGLGGYGVGGRPGYHRRKRGIMGDVGEASMAGAGIGMGRAGAIAGGAYLGGTVVHKAVKSSMDFERKMIEVKKATDASGEELDGYANSLMRLAKDTGKNKEDLAGILTQAGFSGRPKNELMRFTEYGAKASTAWGTTPEETGDALAQIGNIYGADQTEIERIGDQINGMADKSAAKERDLLEIVRRVGGTGKTAGMSSGDILGFGAGLKSRGVQTEIAASGLEDYINFLKLGDEYSKGAEDGIKALGYTSDKLRKAFVAKPTATALEFLDKINAIKDPMKRAEVLTGIFGKTRQDDVERLASSVDDIRKNIELINNPSNYKGSVFAQFADQMQADVSKIDKATQQIDVLMKRVGDPLKKGLGAGAEVLNNAADHIDSRRSNNNAPASQVYNDLPGLEYLREEQRATFDQRFNSAPPSSARRMTFLPNRGNGIPNVVKGVGKGAKSSLGYGNAGMGASPSFAGSFGLGGAQNTGQAQSWMNQGVKETTTSNITNNTNVGNDQRTQSASVTVNATGLAEVAALVKSNVQAGLTSMGPSIVKANSIPTAGGTAASPSP